MYWRQTWYRVFLIFIVSMIYRKASMNLKWKYKLFTQTNLLKTQFSLFDRRAKVLESTKVIIQQRKKRMKSAWRNRGYRASLCRSVNDWTVTSEHKIPSTEQNAVIHCFSTAMQEIYYSYFWSLIGKSYDIHAHKLP